MRPSSPVFVALACAVLTLGAGPVGAAAPEPAEADWAQRWSDQVVGAGVKAGHASGAAVSVVQDGRTMALAGYGRPRPDGSPVDPRRDRFQIASCSKTFLAAVVARLQEEGRLGGVDTPVGAYLRRVPGPEHDGRKVTLRHLLTHTAGFEESGFGYFRHGATTVPAAGDYVRKVTPEIVRRPGERVVYANFDPPLLAAALEDVTGDTAQTLETALIFRPLGMARTTLNYAPDGGPDLARAFDPATGTMTPADVNAPFFAPTGSVITTADDMTRYMNAMLGLAPATFSPAVVRRLTTPLARNHPGLDGVGMYWFLSDWNGEKVVEHAGGLTGVGAWIVLVPSRRIGMFVAWTGGKPPFDYGRLRDSFLSAALGPYLAPQALPPGDLSAFAGRYWVERRNHTTLETLFSLDAVKTVTAGRDGLYVNGDGPYVRIGDALFQRKMDPQRAGAKIAFAGDALVETSNVSRKVSGLTDPQVLSRVWLLCVAVAATGLFSAVWLGGAARWLAPVVATAAMAPPALLFARVQSLVPEALRGVSWTFDLVSACAVGLGLFALALLANLSGRGAVRGGGAKARLALVHAVLVGMAGLGAALLLVHWGALHLFRL